jgi:hypothetical protein
VEVIAGVTSGDERSIVPTRFCNSALAAFKTQIAAMNISQRMQKRPLMKARTIILITIDSYNAHWSGLR